MNHTIMVKSFHTQSADRGFMDFKEPRSLIVGLRSDFSFNYFSTLGFD